jgi:hypothetical protein
MFLLLYLAFSTGRVPGIAASKYATCNKKMHFLEQAKSGTSGPDTGFLQNPDTDRHKFYDQI